MLCRVADTEVHEVATTFVEQIEPFPMQNDVRFTRVVLGHEAYSSIAMIVAGAGPLTTT